MTRPLPYVGVAGVTELAHLLTWPHQHVLVSNAVLASYKSLYGGGNSKPLRYPLPHRLADALPAFAIRGTLRALHYAPMFVEVGAEEPLFVAEVRGAIAWTLGRLDLLQINAAWPSVRALGVIREDLEKLTPGARLVLQVPRNALYHHALDVERVTAAIRGYWSVVTDVLIDISAGTGIRLDRSADSGTVTTIVAELLEACPGLGIGIAGGIAVDTLASAAPFLRKGVSIDAESRLRDHPEERGGTLNLDAVRAYLDAAAAIVAPGAST
jgi:hypothetical protein